MINTTNTTDPSAPSFLAPMTVDNREGSIDLVSHLRAIGIPVIVDRLESGDVAFTGNGPDGEVRVGIEHKTIRDLCGSYATKRLDGSQAPWMYRAYDYSYLVVEGDFMEDPNTGVLQIPGRGGWRDLALGTRRFTYRQIDNYLTSLENVFAVRVRRVRDKWMSAVTIRDLNLWWSKPWDGHRTGKVIYSPPPDSVLLSAPSYVRKAAYQLDGIGWELSGRIDQHFKSAVSMVMAEPWEWAQIDGIGDVRVQRIMGELSGEWKPKPRRRI